MVEAMVVVGSPNSSNTQRLKEVAERAGCPRAALVQRATRDRLVGVRLASRASASPPAPRRRRSWSRRSSAHSPSAIRVSVETVTTADEDMFFPLPRVLRGTEAAE